MFVSLRLGYLYPRLSRLGYLYPPALVSSRRACVNCTLVRRVWVHCTLVRRVWVICTLVRLLCPAVSPVVSSVLRLSVSVARLGVI